MTTILGIDYGERRIGVAKADAESRTAVVVATLDSANCEDALKQVISMMSDHNAERVVVGLPLSLSGGDTAQTVATRAFVAALKERVSVPVATVDERLTTKQGGSDAGAAVVLLQSYLDRESHG